MTYKYKIKVDYHHRVENNASFDQSKRIKSIEHSIPVQYFPYFTINYVVASYYFLEWLTFYFERKKIVSKVNWNKVHQFIYGSLFSISEHKKWNIWLFQLFVMLKLKLCLSKCWIRTYEQYLWIVQWINKQKQKKKTKIKSAAPPNNLLISLLNTIKHNKKTIN